MNFKILNANNYSINEINLIRENLLIDGDINFLEENTINRTLPEIFSDYINPLNFGVNNKGEDDNLPILQTLTTNYKNIKWPAGTYKLSNTLTMTTEQNWIADGQVKIVLDLPYGSTSRPVLDFKATCNIQGQFIVDQQCQAKGLVVTDKYGGNIVASSCVLVQGDDSQINGMIPINGFDCGIAVVKLIGETGEQEDGSPKRVSLSNIIGRDHGSGDRPPIPGIPNSGGRAGGTINILTGSICNVTNCIDFGSYNGFILDYGGGANGNFNNCIAYNTKRDPNFPRDGTGVSFWIGSADSTFNNCMAIGGQSRGFWADGNSQNVIFNNCMAISCKTSGFVIQGNNTLLTNCIAKKCSENIDNDTGHFTTPAFRIVGYNNTSNNIGLINCNTNGAFHTYGLSVDASESPVNAYVIGCSFNGTLGEMNLPSQSGYVSVFKRDNGGYFSFYHNNDRKMNISPTAVNIDTNLNCTGSISSTGYINTVQGYKTKNWEMSENDFGDLLLKNNDTIPTIRFYSDNNNTIVNIQNTTYDVNQTSSLRVGFSSAYGYIKNLLPGSNKARVTIGYRNNDQNVDNDTIFIQDGNVGIGSLSTGEKLEVTGNIKGNSLILNTQTSDPPSPFEGQVYYNSTSKTVKIYNGTSWLTISAS